MKKILFFITATIFIIGCGAPTPQTLTYETAKTGKVIIVRNVNDAFLQPNKQQLISDFEKYSNLKATEFTYSSVNDCTYLGYTRFNAEDKKGDSETPNIYTYYSLSGDECIEYNFSSTSSSGSSGLTLLLK